MGNRCNKAGYASKERAKQYAKKRMKEDRRLRLRVYKCPECRKWHMTKTQRKRY